MAARAKRRPRILVAEIAAGGTVDVLLPQKTVEFRLRVVDAVTFAPVAFTLAYGRSLLSRWHFVAAESYHEEGIAHSPSPITLVLGAAVAARVELVAWSC